MKLDMGQFAINNFEIKTVCPLRKHAYSNTQKSSPPKTDFLDKKKTLIFFIYLHKT